MKLHAASSAPPVRSSTRSRRTAFALFALAVAFWPAFLLATILEDQIPLPWLQTGEPILWLPLIVVAFACGVAAPFFTPWPARRKLLGALGATLTFVAMYGLVTWIGLSFFDWSD